MNQRLQNTAFYARLPYYSGHRKAWRGLPKPPKREPFARWTMLGIGAQVAYSILASDTHYRRRRERPNP